MTYLRSVFALLLVLGVGGMRVPGLQVRGALASAQQAKPTARFACQIPAPSSTPVKVRCVLSGSGFSPGEHIQVTYTLDTFAGRKIIHRHSTVDPYGQFLRPAIRFYVYCSFTLRASVVGSMRHTAQAHVSREC